MYITGLAASCPSWLHPGKMMFTPEIEYTAAAFGTPDDKGMVQNAEEVGNLRVLVGVFYFFREVIKIMDLRNE